MILKSTSAIAFVHEGVEIQHVLSSAKPVHTVHDDVHIHPSFMEFKEASEGITCDQRITIKNTGTKSAYIKIYQTKSISFQVKVLDKGVLLNPGLSIHTTVTYNFKRPSLLRAVIPIEINGKIIDYRVICKLLVEGISIEPKSIDFDIVDIGYSSGVKIITLKNEGGKSTRFSIDLGTNDLEITVQPLHGIVKPNKPVQLTVELIGMNEGVFFSEFWIKSVPNIRVPFNVKVIVPRLTIYHPNTTGDFTLIDFSQTVVNTRKYDTFVVRNISSQVASYVVLGEIGNELVCVRDINRKKYPVYSVFEIRPIQGRIGPFEGIIFEVGFSPVDSLLQWRERVGRKLSRREKDFMAFLRIVRVHVTETKNTFRINETIRDQLNESTKTVKDNQEIKAIIVDESSSSSTVSSMDIDQYDTVRLCLHGEVEAVRINFVPDTLYFGDLLVGEDSQRVVRISNPSNFAPLLCRYVHNASARCYPHMVTLKPEGSIEVLLKVKGKENINSSFEVFFDVEADSCESTKTRRQTKVKVGSYPLQCRVNVKLLTTTKQSCMSRVRGAFEDYYEDLQKPAKDTRKIASTRPLAIKPKRVITAKQCDDDEIVQKVTRIPKWKCKSVSERVKCVSIDKMTTPLKASTEILIPLSPLQIYNIRMYPTFFAFGMIVPRSRNYKQLVMENLNDFSIMIRLTSFSSKYIHFPEGNLIILPPGVIIKRLIELRVYQLGKFNSYIDYIINDNHSFEIGITADVVEKQLSLDIREVVFGREWLKEEVYRPMDSTVQIKNKLDARTSFRWEVPSLCCFYLEPISGVIRGNSSLYTYIYYKPDFTKASSTELIFKCENNSYTTVRISIPVQTSKVSFIKDIISVGEIPLNLPTKAVAFLRNFEYVEIEYEVDSSSLMHGCTISPLRGVIPPRAFVALEIYLMFNICFHFTMAICVTVQKHVNLQLKVTGHVSFPQLKLHPHSINLRRISCSAYQCFLLTATNVGTSMLKLKFLLEEYPEFRISFSSKRQDPEIGHEDTFIAPNTSQEFHLHFEPVDLASYAFYLPFVVNDILGPVVIANPKTLRPSEYLKHFKGYYTGVPNITFDPLPATITTLYIDFTVAGHVIFFNKLMFHFNVLSNNVSDEFSIENRESMEEKFILIDISNFSVAGSPFSIQWVEGERPIVTRDCIQCMLQNGERCSFVVAFQPKSRGTFAINAPIFIRNELNDEMFNELCLVGEYPASTIQANTSELYFTPVPLNVSIERKLRLTTRYFEKDTVIVAKKLVPEYCNGKYTDSVILIQFIDDNVASASEQSELDVRIIFKSEVSVSFRTVIKFSDEGGMAVCPVMIHATADNCLLTTHMYIKNSTMDYQCTASDYKRASHGSKMTESITDDEDYDSYTYQNTDTSLSKIGIVTYFGRRSQFSVDPLIDNKYKFTTYELPHTGKKSNTFTYLNKSEENTTKFQPDKRESVRTIKPPPKFEALEPMYYPFFPFGDDTDDHEIHMHQTLQAAEEWLYSGPYKFNFYADISSIKLTLSKFYSKRPAQFKTTSRKGLELGFVGVLESLIGPAIYDSIGQFKELPEKDIDRANYIFNLYDNILNFLTKHGAHLCHVSPQLLLNYEEYIVLLESTRNKTHARKLPGIDIPVWEKLSLLKFNCRSKQCWLDVILQTFKCFALPRTFESKSKVERLSNHQLSRIPSAASLRKEYDSHNTILGSINAEMANKSPNNTYTFEELFLLEWLGHHYEAERKQEWMIDHRVVLNPNESKNVAEPRNMENFDKDLADSLVLITVTAAYCPFLIEEHLSNLYIRPRSYEEALHNAVCVVDAWRKIRLGFIISPLEIIYPNCVKMLMLVAHLFTTLPTYTPKAKVKFSCPLSETVTKQISFGNPTGQNVDYLTIFFGNNNGFFTTPSSQAIISLDGHENTAVKVQFYAKKIKRTRAYLLFCGSTIGPNFSRNQTFVLEGEADSLGVANVYTICSKLYEIVNTTLTINVPYKNTTEYEIWSSEERPSKASTLKQTRWAELCLRKIPRRLFLNQKSIVIKEGTTKAYLSVTVACLSACHRSFWIIFQSKMGDFIIQINSRWQTSLTDNIVVEWNEPIENCICTEQDYNELCPLNLTVLIPSKNKQLWSSVAHMFQKTLDQKEREFWSRYLDTQIGLRLIRWLMGDSEDSAAKEFTHMFDATVTYNVTISETTNILRYPKTFTINDVRPSSENVPMKIHISPLAGRLCKIVLNLISSNGSECRVYAISFLHVKRLPL